MRFEGVVHVVDDDDAVRRSIAFLLASAGIPVRLYDGASAFLDTLAEGPKGCVVTDVRMPEIDGLELQRRLRRQGSPLAVVIITGHADVPLAVQAMREGAIDFIEKPFDDERFLAAVQAALARSETEERTVSMIAEARSRVRTLSERERQVMEGVLSGKPNKVIAHDLGISARTVEIYRANVMTKMRAESLPDLVRKVLHAGAV